MSEEQKPRDARVYEISGDQFVAMTTERLLNEFGWSRPHPRDWKIGFPPDLKKKKRIEAMKKLGL